MSLKCTIKKTGDFIPPEVPQHACSTRLRGHLKGRLKRPIHEVGRDCADYVRWEVER